MQAKLLPEEMGHLQIDKAEAAKLSAAFAHLHKRHLARHDLDMAVAATGRPDLPGNIIGLGYGEKITANQATGRAAVKVFVRKKVQPQHLAEATLIPASFNGAAIDVEEVGEVSAFVSQYRTRQRPAPGGVSIGNCLENAAGTLGCLVRSGQTNYLLSNNHVMARCNAAVAGEPIAQQGRYDNGACPDDEIAQLTRFIALDFAGGANYVDGAIAELNDNALAIPQMLRNAGRLEPLKSPQSKPILGMKVQKSGRTTGHTHGQIDAVQVTINVQYGGQIARFDNQFRVSGTMGRFSDSGDSGSLVTADPANVPVGLLFAGGPVYTFCNDIARVLADLQVAILY